jgi:hypothetical protein
MSNKAAIDNILRCSGDEAEEIFLYNTNSELRNTSSPLFLVFLIILAILTFVFIYKKNAKGMISIEDHIEFLKEYISNKIDKFFAFLHIDGQTIKKVMTE